jgi:hypothetical protein
VLPPLETVQRSHGQLVSPSCINRRRHRTARRALERGRCILQLRSRFGVVHLAQSEHCVPKGKRPPLMFGIAHRSQMQGTASQSLFVTIETTREQIPPHAHAALAATVKTRILLARVLGCALEATQQPDVSSVESTSHIRSPHSELPQRARRFLAEDVARGCRRDAFTSEQDNALRALGRESGEGTSVRTGQRLSPNDPPCGPTAFGRREGAAIKVRRIDGVYGPRKTGRVDQHAQLGEKADRLSPELVDYMVRQSLRSP